MLLLIRLSLRTCAAPSCYIYCGSERNLVDTVVDVSISHLLGLIALRRRLSHDLTTNRAVSAEPSAIEDALRILLTSFLGGRVAATFVDQVTIVRHAALVLVNGHGRGL